MTCKYMYSLLKHLVVTVMFAFISFNQLKEYLSLLVENGLIQYEEGTHTFRTTEKGRHFLKLQNKIDEVAPISFISEK
jgi:predicted transcriptional regulator